MRIEDHIKERLSEMLGEVHPSDDAWASIERRMAGRRRRASLARGGTIALALVLAFGGLAGAWVVFQRRGPSPGLVEAPTPPTPRIGVTIDVGEDGQVASALFAEGSLWVAGYESGVIDGFLARVDPSTERVVARIPIQAVPGWETGGDGMAAGFGSIWVTGGTGDQALLQRIDPSTNSVVATVTLPGGFGGDVEVGETAVWVSVEDTDRAVPELHLVRVSPETNEVQATVPLEGDWIREVFAFPEAIVVRTLDREVTVLRIVDPSTNQVVGRCRLGVVGGPFAAGPGVLWVGAGNELLRLDPRTGAALADPVSLDRTVSWQASLLVEEEGVWFLGSRPEDDTAPPAVERYGHRAGDIDVSVTPPGTPIVMALGADSVWLLNYDGTVTRIELVP